MKVELLFNSGIEIVEEACKIPYQTKKAKGLAKRVWNSGHRSVARHSVVVFKIEGVSQSLLRQISRHPHINLTVESSRYCDMQGNEIYVPDSIIKNVELETKYNEDMQKIKDIYSQWRLIEENIEVDDISKLFLPLGSTMEMIISGNYQAMYEFLQLRICTRAEKEIRDVTKEMKNILVKEVPDIFAKIDCKAIDNGGFCPESDCCGRYPKQ